jgi:hypothetical protein
MELNHEGLKAMSKFLPLAKMALCKQASPQISPHKYFHRLVLVETKLYLFCNYTLMQVCSVKFPKISPAVTKKGTLLV